jgi:acetyltransferase-like isoleucine patch superfamily enzyme
LRRRPRKSRREPIRERFAVGRGTYGEPTVLQSDNNATLRIGTFCSIARNVTIILSGGHRTDWITTYPFMHFRDSARAIEAPLGRGDVIIGNDVWIGFGATILSGVTIGNGAVIGAQALVTKDVPAYAIAAGNPAKSLRRRFPDETIHILEQLAWWDWEDAILDRAMPLLLSVDVSGLVRFAEKELGIRVDRSTIAAPPQRQYESAA